MVIIRIQVQGKDGIISAQINGMEWKGKGMVEEAARMQPNAALPNVFSCSKWHVATLLAIVERP